MPSSLELNGRTIRLVRHDITDLDLEAFVYYARHDLQLGSGFGTAIAQRGGPKIQQELEALAPLQTTEAVVSGAGNLKAGHIVHAVGPRFQEEDLPAKLAATVRNCLAVAAAKGIRRLAFPAMGAGFYGVPLPLSAEVTLETLAAELAGGADLEEVVVCVLDSREEAAFAAKLESMRAPAAQA